MLGKSIKHDKIWGYLKMGIPPNGYPKSFQGGKWWINHEMWCSDTIFGQTRFRLKCPIAVDKCSFDKKNETSSFWFSYRGWVCQNLMVNGRNPSSNLPACFVKLALCYAVKNVRPNPSHAGQIDKTWQNIKTSYCPAELFVIQPMLSHHKQGDLMVRSS